MDVKHYLKQVRMLDMKINQRIEERKYLSERAVSTGVFMDPNKVQRTSRSSGMEDLIVKYLEIEKEIDDTIDEYVNLKHKIIGEIQQLDNVQHVDCLVQRYIEGRSFEAIASDMGYSVRRVFQIHGDALQAFKAKHFI